MFRTLLLFFGIVLIARHVCLALRAREEAADDACVSVVAGAVFDAPAHSDGAASQCGNNLPEAAGDVQRAGGVQTLFTLEAAVRTVLSAVVGSAAHADVVRLLSEITARPPLTRDGLNAHIASVNALEVPLPGECKTILCVALCNYFNLVHALRRAEAHVAAGDAKTEDSEE